MLAALLMPATGTGIIPEEIVRTAMSMPAGETTLLINSHHAFYQAFFYKGFYTQGGSHVDTLEHTTTSRFNWCRMYKNVI
jgi:hypothetical protein